MRDRLRIVSRPRPEDPADPAERHSVVLRLVLLAVIGLIAMILSAIAQR